MLFDIANTCYDLVPKVPALEGILTIKQNIYGNMTPTKSSLFFGNKIYAMITILIKIITV